MMAILPGVKSKADIEKAWSTVDRNGDGRLSYQELRPVLRASSGLNEDSTDKPLGPLGAFMLSRLRLNGEVQAPPRAHMHIE